MSKTTLESSRSQLEARLKELQPFREEAREIERVLDAFKGRVPRKRPASAERPTRQVDRATELLGVIRKNPGISIAAAAERMNMEPNYLYRIGRRLAEDGQIVTTDTEGYGKGYVVASEKVEETQPEVSQEEASTC